MAGAYLAPFTAAMPQPTLRVQVTSLGWEMARQAAFGVS
jgi:hypothetical protein